MDQIKVCDFFNCKEENLWQSRLVSMDLDASGVSFSGLRLENPNIEILGINDPFIDPEYMVYMLRYDTVHGRFKGSASYKENAIIVNGREIAVYACMNAAEIPWKRMRRGVHRRIHRRVYTTMDKAKAPTLKAARRKSSFQRSFCGCAHVCYGCQPEHLYDPDMNIVSNASCTTNCLAPLAKVIDDNFGIIEGLMTTVHATTATQKTVDGPSKKDWRGGRGAAFNIIPSSTGAAKAVGKVIPKLNGKLTGMSFPSSYGGCFRG